MNSKEKKLQELQTKAEQKELDLNDKKSESKKPLRLTKESVLASFNNYSAKNFIRIVKYLYKYQTATEQHVGNSHVVNNVGFSKYHAPFATSLIQWADGHNGELTHKQFLAAKKMMTKYAKQLAELRNNEIVKEKQLESQLAS